MLKHETKLIDPDAEQIVAALSRATADANKRCRARLLPDDESKWQKCARDATARPEGYAMFRGGKGGVPATQVLAAWWTDAIGRKHVVVRGRRVEHDQAKRLILKDELEKRPALWHAYPEYVCRRTVGDEALLVCACGCGAVGTPAALGWMGETCGPCFDRKEESGAGALHANLPGVLYGDRAPLGAVACSPDGTRVAAVEGDNCVSYWDVATRTRTTMKFSGVRVVDVAITADGAHLIAVGINVMTPGGLFAAFDLGADPPKRVDPGNEAPPGWRVAALPDPGLAVVHRPDPAGDEPSALGAIVRVPSGEVVSAHALPPGYCGRFAVSPDGTRLASVLGNGTAAFDLGTGARLYRITGNFAHVAFSHNGARLIAASRDAVWADDANTGRPPDRIDLGAKRHGTPINWISALAVDPAGKWVFVGGSAGTVAVADAQTLDRAALFEWHLGIVTGLAVSADGSRLFSSGTDGCVKVWPVSALLKT